MKKQLLRLVALMTTLMLAVLPLAGLAEETDAVDKKETVFVLAGADGTPLDIVVSEKLHNADGAATLNDVSSLTDIENLSGDETFTAENGALVWDAQGNDIHYEGKSDAELPVGLKITYTLDGAEIAPADLAGKSGHLVMTLDYSTKVTAKATVSGEEIDMPVPFFMATLMLADSANFKNVTVENGKVLEMGDRTAVLCYGLPGLSDALDLASYEDIDLEIPTQAKVEGDVTDFTFSGAYTIAANSLETSLDGDSFSLSVDLDEVGGELTDAMTQLLDGGDQLLSGAKELSDGLNEISANSADLVAGARTIFETVLATANETLAESSDAFAANGITINELTIDNYADEIDRIESELLETVNEEVLRQADALLKTKVTEAVRKEVRSQVTTAVKAEVKTKVTEVAKGQVTQAVTAAVEEQVRAKVTEAVRAQVVPQVTEAVRAEVTSQVDASLDDAVKAQVTSAVQQQVEQQVRANADAIRAQVTQGYEASIRQAVEASITDEMRQTMTEDELKAYIDAAVAKSLADKSGEIDATVESTIQDTIAKTMASDEIQQKIAAATQQQLANRDALLKKTVDEKMASSDVQAIISSKTDEQMASDSVKALIDQNTAQQMASSDVQATIQQNVDAQMASDSIKKTIADNTEAQMKTDDVQKIIDDNTEAQMKTPKVQKIIDDNISQQRAMDSFWEAVDEAEQENGVNSDAYQALVKLHSTLDDMRTFYEGVISYTGAVDTAAEGAGELYDGISELCDGLNEFNEQAVGKLTSFLDDDLPGLKDRLEAVGDVMGDYQSYGGIRDDMTGTTHFIIRTEGI